MNFKFWREKGHIVGWLIAGLIFTSIPHSVAAPNLYYNTLKSDGSGCVTKYDAAFMQTGRLIARKSIRISAINVAIGTSNRSNFNSTRYHIFANNPATNAPGTQLATFTPDAISGTNAMSVARYVGDYSISSGTKFWIVPGQLPTVQSQCYFTSSGNPSEFNINGVTPDSSTSNSNSLYWRAYSTSSSPVGATWSDISNFSLIVQLSLEAGQAMPVSVTLSMQSGLQQTSFRTVSPIVASVDTTSRVTFYANGRVISGCRNIMSTSGTATCNWKPQVHGSFRLHASAIPLDDLYVASNSSFVSVGVGARTNRR